MGPASARAIVVVGVNAFVRAVPVTWQSATHRSSWSPTSASEQAANNNTETTRRVRMATRNHAAAADRDREPPSAGLVVHLLTSEVPDFRSAWHLWSLAIAKTVVCAGSRARTQPHCSYVVSTVGLPTTPRMGLKSCFSWDLRQCRASVSSRLTKCLADPILEVRRLYFVSRTATKEPVRTTDSRSAWHLWRPILEVPGTSGARF